MIYRASVRVKFFTIKDSVENENAMQKLRESISKTKSMGNYYGKMLWTLETKRIAEHKKEASQLKQNSQSPHQRKNTNDNGDFKYQ